VVTLLGEPVLITVSRRRGRAAPPAGRRRLALFVVVARVGAVVLSSGLKLAVDRARPVFDEPIATALGASFPAATRSARPPSTSPGRCCCSRTSGATACCSARPVLVAAAVAVSRVLLGVHYPSDVVAGLLIGLGWAVVCTAVFAAWRADEGRPVDVVEEGIGHLMRDASSRDASSRDASSRDASSRDASSRDASSRDPVEDLRSIAFCLERALEPSYRVRAFRTAAATVAATDATELQQRAANGTLVELPGIGKVTATVVTRVAGRRGAGLPARVQTLGDTR
jgi:hypothetical protein